VPSNGRDYREGSHDDCRAESAETLQLNGGFPQQR
jgi:hypothetical protein